MFACSLSGHFSSICWRGRVCIKRETFWLISIAPVARSLVPTFYRGFYHALIKKQFEKNSLENLKFLYPKAEVAEMANPDATLVNGKKNTKRFVFVWIKFGSTWRCQGFESDVVNFCLFVFLSRQHIIVLLVFRYQLSIFLISGPLSNCEETILNCVWL